MIEETEISCGVRQLSDLSIDPSDDVAEVAYEIFHEEEDFTFVLFSDIEYTGRGIALAEFIKKKGLGTIVKSRVKVNPNTGNKIRVYIWGLNRQRLFPYLKDVSELNDTEYD